MYIFGIGKMHDENGDLIQVQGHIWWASAPFMRDRWYPNVRMLNDQQGNGTI